MMMTAPVVETTEETFLQVVPVEPPNAPKRGKLLKEHALAVTYPDGGEGMCRYQRYGPKWHLLEYEHGDGEAYPLARLPRQYQTNVLNGVADVERVMRETAKTAFDEAIRLERQDRFTRVTLPYGSPKPDPARFQMTPKRAKVVAGKYALCCTLGSRLIPVSQHFDDIYQAAEELANRGDCLLVLACASRLERCWLAPRFIPLPK